MQHLPKPTLQTQGFELLSFDHVELTKTKLGSKHFMEVGRLSVVFLPEYDRVFLYLGKWEFVLLKRLPVVCSSRTDFKDRYYTFPTYNGFYTARVHKITHPEAIQNFETILSFYSKFSYYGEDLPVRHLDRSPDTSFSEENLDFSQTLVSGTTMFGKQVDPLMSDEFKDGKLKGSQKIKKGFAKFADKFSGRSKHQEKNPRMFEVMDISSIVRIDDTLVPVDNFGRLEVESSITKSKDMSRKMGSEIVRHTTIEDVKGFERTMSVDMCVTIENGIEFMVTRSEMEILDAIEKERELQVQERMLQEKHRTLELAYIEKERELRLLMRTEQEKRKCIDMHAAQERFQVEINHREEMIEEHAKYREAEHMIFEQKERELIREIEMRLDELRAKDMMTEEERLEFARREKELITANKRLDMSKHALEVKEKKLIQKSHMKELDLKERAKMIDIELYKLKEREREVERELKARLDELKAKTVLTEKERMELLAREKEMERFIMLKENERIQIEKEQEEMAVSGALLLAELAERKLLTEAESDMLIVKEKEMELQAHLVMADLRTKEILTEEERVQLEEKQKQLKRIAAMREMERVEFVRKQRELEVEAGRREAELREKERLTLAEREELEKIAKEMLIETEMQEVEREELSMRRMRLLEEAERREEEIVRRELLTELERMEIYQKEEEMEMELERKLAELKVKEMLTEEERMELKEREMELVKIKEMREVEMKVRGSRVEKIREQENKLLAKNIEMIMGHKEMQREIKDMKKDLDQPSTVVFEESVEKKKQVAFEDLSRC